MLQLASGTGMLLLQNSRKIDEQLTEFNSCTQLVTRLGRGTPEFYSCVASTSHAGRVE